MKKLLIATHAHFASGIKSSIELLSGPKDNIKTIDAFVDDTNIQLEIDKFIESISEEDQAFIFTDIKFGSVNQTVINSLTPYPDNIFVITGFNLPLVLELCLTDEYFSKDRVEKIVEEAKQEIIFMNYFVSNDSNSEDDFFK